MPKTKKRKTKKKASKLPKYPLLKIPKERAYHSLWVYYTDWTPKIKKAVGRLRNDGSGCCTDGYADSSFTIKDPKKGAAIAKKAVRAGAAFAYVVGDTPDRGYHTSSMVVGRRLTKKLKSNLRRQCQNRKAKIRGFKAKACKYSVI
jgi:hypothetical protein